VAIKQACVASTSVPDGVVLHMMGTATDNLGATATATSTTTVCTGLPGSVCQFTAPAGGTCAGKPCWASKPKGFQYKDKLLMPDGIAQLQLSAGADGKAKVQVKGKGANLPMPSLATLTSPLIVQLHPSSGGVCFGATYSFPPVIKNNGVRSKTRLIDDQSMCCPVRSGSAVGLVIDLFVDLLTL